MCAFLWVAAVRALGTVPAEKCVLVGAFLVLLMVVVPMVAEKADVDAHQEREDEGL